MAVRKRPRKNASAMRMVGALVAQFRRNAGLTQRELSARLVVAEVTIASIEQGVRPLLPDLAEALDQVLGSQGALAVAVANMPEIDQFPLWAESYIEHERDALALSKYDALAIPGLLQTPGYARAVLQNRVPAYDLDEVETKVAARVGRQDILHRRVPPTISFVVWEPALRMAFCDEQVRDEQVRHLCTITELPGLTLQFLPLDAPAHAGLDGPFTLLETPEHQHLAYTETQRGSQWVSEPDEVSILARKYAMLRSQALSPADSKGLLDRLLGERWAPH
ncbi:helix-turn-helix transcriptional regulator [Streptomyces sp. N35]|uniref:helix-turn-helix domain-containing protein n=1 Tax=Streptomyces sp. N35 TaxID=2795730 RepID=UPI0018F6184C|nr:helix-turn-helix transcriptional regulator [Streptomyces sp. N35]